jgi:hypothetical protein
VTELEGEPNNEPDNVDNDNFDDLYEEFEALTTSINLCETTAITHADVTHADAILETQISTIDATTAAHMTTNLMDQSTMHAISSYLNPLLHTHIQCNRSISPARQGDSLTNQSTPCTDSKFLVEGRYNDRTFHGIMIDTGAAGKSTAGYSQYLAYQRTFDINIPIDATTKDDVNATFGIGSASSIGSINIPTPIGTIEFHVVEVETPFLMSIKDMDAKGIMLDNLQDKLVKMSGDTIPIVRRFGHPFMM